ncbi:MAG TPA: peptidase M15 [Desulfobacteraceae bacterium]|nr:peptidase M15 [Desulfobacteraceae bacterium]
MDRRAFLKSAGGMVVLNVFCSGTGPLAAAESISPALGPEGFGCRNTGPDTPGSDTQDPAMRDSHIKDQLIKSKFFDRHFDDDVVLGDRHMGQLRGCLTRIKRLQRLVGYANFCLLGFDEALAYAKGYARVGRFTKEELGFLEKIFYSPAAVYGFKGEKPIPQMTDRIPEKDTVKIKHTGNYLFRGKPVETYGDIRKQIGRDAVLTSGVRGVMKQFLLFLNKAAESRGNLSMASRSLAPPGYSFHGTGDFDVGERGFGIDNFTEKFTQTRVYNKLSDLGYIKFRYDRENDLGVRFEPWHVEVG